MMLKTMGFTTDISFFLASFACGVLTDFFGPLFGDAAKNCALLLAGD